MRKNPHQMIIQFPRSFPILVGIDWNPHCFWGDMSIQMRRSWEGDVSVHKVTHVFAFSLDSLPTDLQTRYQKIRQHNSAAYGWYAMRGFYSVLTFFMGTINNGYMRRFTILGHFSLVQRTGHEMVAFLKMCSLYTWLAQQFFSFLLSKFTVPSTAFFGVHLCDCVFCTPLLTDFSNALILCLRTA